MHIFIHEEPKECFFISYFLFYFQEITNLKFCTEILLFFVTKETKLRLFCKAKQTRMGGTAKPLPLSLAKLCSSCGRKTTRRLLRSQAKKSATETTLEEEAKARIERRRRKKGSSITLLSSIPFTIFFSRL